MTPEDHSVIALQLGRRPRDVTGVAVRCPFGRPAVIETAPVLSDGTPNPTLLYVTCPTLAAAVSRVEAGGGVRRLRARYGEDDRLRALLDEITTLYRERRAFLAAEGADERAGESDDGATSPGGCGTTRPARLAAGVGGPPGPERASCLHAYAAALLAVRSGWLGTGPAALAHGLLSEVERVWPEFYPPLEETWCRDDRCAAATMPRRRAVVDVGTISVRLLVAEVIGDRVETIVRRTEITRMGEGLRPGGRLLPAAAKRTADAVSRFVAEARQLEPSGILLAGTSATREAADGREFLLSLAENLGVQSVVLTGREEAESAYAGATIDIAGDPLVLDIGGGSTELSRRKGIRFDTVSLDIGASKATERWIETDPPRTADIDLVRQEAKGMFEPLLSRFRGRLGTQSAAGQPGPGGAGDWPVGEATGERPGREARLVGVAGTVTTLACLAAGLERYDREALHLRVLTREEVQEQLDRLAGMTLDQRAVLPCVQTGRAPVIVGGAAVLLAAMETLGFTEMIVSERDLLDGLALTL